MFVIDNSYISLCDRVCGMSSAVNPLRTDDQSNELPLSERAYIGLRDMVVTLEVAPGAPINEDRLSKQLGFGRTPIREAIKRLESEGLVVIYPRRGTFATEVNITDHRLIADVRWQLEGHAAKRAAQNTTETDRERLTSLLDYLREEGGDPAHLVKEDTAVHRAVYHCTHNQYLESTLNQYFNLALRIWYLFLERLPDMTDHVGEHIPLLEAIIEADPERAHTIAEHHVAHFERAIRHAI